MLEMIFNNVYDCELTNDYDYCDYSLKYNNHHKQHTHIAIPNNTRHYYDDNNNDDDEWGFYLELDQRTPPKPIYPTLTKEDLAISKNSSKYQTCQKNKKNINVNIHLPQTKEEHEDHVILDLFDSSSMELGYEDDSTKQNISRGIFSGLTICALTTAVYYFYNKIRSA
jgi:hypothetical protein